MSTRTSPLYEDLQAPKRDRVWTYAPTLFRWGLALIVLAAPPIYLGLRPDDYTPLVETVLNVFLFLLAFWIGNSYEAAKAAQQANDRWLPQAESVIFRLMTLHANVRRFSLATKTSCQQSVCDLPELRNDGLRAVRVKLKTDCEAASQRLDDIAHQLEDAIEDWRRFVAANCAGDECSRIFEALTQREQKLRKEIDALQSSQHTVVEEDP